MAYICLFLMTNMEQLNVFLEETGAQGYGMIAWGALAIVLIWRLVVVAVRIMRGRPFGEKAGREGVSVIITSHNRAEALAANLPYFLEQDYDDYEVIVVDECSEDDTADVLGRLEERYPRLRSTKVPQGAKFRSTKKLAINIGVLAARHDVLLFAEANCRPASRNWAREMEACFAEGVSVVVGFANYEAGKASGRLRLFRALRFMRMLAAGGRKGNMPGDGCNMGYRKRCYLENKGFRNSQSYVGYDTDMVRDLAKFGIPAVARNADTYMTVEPDGRAGSVDDVAYYAACQMERPLRERVRSAVLPVVRAVFYVAGVCLACLTDYPLVVAGTILLFFLAEVVMLNWSLRRLRQRRLFWVSLLAVAVGFLYAWGINICLFFNRKRWR